MRIRGWRESGRRPVRPQIHAYPNAPSDYGGRRRECLGAIGAADDGGALTRSA